MLISCLLGLGLGGWVCSFWVLLVWICCVGCDLVGWLERGLGVAAGLGVCRLYL